MVSGSDAVHDPRFERRRDYRDASDQPVIAVAQARMLDMAGWQVQITDRACRQYQPEKFEQLLSFDRKSAISSRAKRSRQRA
jgi:hypothetical protein